MLTLRHLGSNPIRDNEDLQEQVTRLSSTVQMFQDWGHRSDDRLLKLESSVSCIQGSVRELKEKCKLLETKLKLQELREERLEILAVALERFYDESTVAVAESDREMSTPRRRSERKRNLDKLRATEKCRPDLDFPERMKTPVKTSVPVLPRVLQRTGENPFVPNISQKIITVRTRDIEGEKLVGNEHRTLTTTENQPKEIVKNVTEIRRLSEQTCNETVDKQGENGKVEKVIMESFVCGSSNSIASKKNHKSNVEQVNQNKNSNSEKVVDKPKQGDVRIYKCSYCTKTFRCKQSFREHELAHVKGKLKCSRCDYETDFRRCLRGHEKRQHVNSNIECNSESLTTKTSSPIRRKKKNKVLKIKLPMTPNKSFKSVEHVHNHITSASFPLNNRETSENSAKANLRTSDPLTQSSLSTTRSTNTPMSNEDQISSEPPRKKKNKVLKIKLPMTPNKSFKSVEHVHNHITSASFPLNNRETSENSAKANLRTSDPLTQSSLSTTGSTNTPMKNEDQINSEPPRKKKKTISKNISSTTSSLSSINSPDNHTPELLDSRSKKRESYSSAPATSSADIQQPQESLKEAILPPSSDLPEVHACPFCSKTCRNISKLEKHLLRKH